MNLIVEFLGLSRGLAQTPEASISVAEGASYRDALAATAERFPALIGPVLQPRTYDLAPALMMNVNGRYAVRDLDAPAADGQRLIIMFLEAGG